MVQINHCHLVRETERPLCSYMYTYVNAMTWCAGTKNSPKSLWSHVLFVIYIKFQIKNAGGEGFNQRFVSSIGNIEKAM